MKIKKTLFGIVFLTILAISGCGKKTTACCDVPATGTLGNSVSFSSACSKDGVKYEWNFGDGSSVSTEANPSHIYLNPGTYTVKLMVMDKKGSKMDDTSKSIVIS